MLYYMEVVSNANPLIWYRVDGFTELKLNDDVTRKAVAKITLGNLFTKEGVFVGFSDDAELFHQSWHIRLIPASKLTRLWKWLKREGKK